MTGFRLHSAEMARFSSLRQLLAAESRFRPQSLGTPWWLDTFADRAMLSVRDWKAGERVLDIGCGFSLLPQWLMESYGVEAWGADDFHRWPADSTDAFIAKSPVRYVKEFLGEPSQSSLPPRSFDCVYSKLALHLIDEPHRDVLHHMQALLRETPGSEITLLTQCRLASSYAPDRGLAALDEIDAMETQVRDLRRAGKPAPEALWSELHRRGKLLSTSPFLYCAYVLEVLGASGEPPESLRALNVAFDPNILIDPPYAAAMDACVFRDAAVLNTTPYLRPAALILRVVRA
jgi:hypothetical protein